MTGRTHDLAAFTALTLVVATTHILPHMSLGTALVAFGANMIGGLAPDIDQPSASLYGKIRGGRILAKIIDPLLGSHRFLSHSIIGIGLFAAVSWGILSLAKSFLLVDMQIVWWSFMIGFISHLVMDTFTKEGIPWLFPIPIRFGIPPLQFFRVKTGGLIEKSIIFPGLLLLNGYIIYSNYDKFLDLLKSHIR